MQEYAEDKALETKRILKRSSLTKWRLWQGTKVFNFLSLISFWALFLPSHHSWLYSISWKKYCFFFNFDLVECLKLTWVIYFKVCIQSHYMKWLMMVNNYMDDIINEYGNRKSSKIVNSPGKFRWNWVVGLNINI